MNIFKTLTGNYQKNLVNNNSKNLSEILVKDIMSKQLIVASSHTTIYQISKIMEQGIGSVLIKIDSTPVGIITDRDFAIKVAANKYPLDTPVGKIASIPLHTIDSNQSILDAAKYMSSKKIRKIAVVENGIVVGIITSSDLVNQLSMMTK